jgi:hypothetical protein
MSAMGTALPRLTDLYMERSMFDSQRSDVPAEEGEGNLYAHSGQEGHERGEYRGMVRHSSLYTQTALSPGKALLAAGLGLAVFAGIRSLTSRNEGHS